MPENTQLVADAHYRYAASIHVEYPLLDLQDPMWAPIISFLMNPNRTLTVKPPVPLRELVLLNHVLHCKVMLDSSVRMIHQLVIPVSIVPIVLKLAHDAPHSVHSGKNRTIKQTRPKYYWPKMPKQIDPLMWINV